MGVTEDCIFKSRWLNFERIYEQVGWDVEYEKPGWNETGPATFHFRAKNPS